MDKNRNYILDRITSKKTSIEEFNFDQLQAPPLSWFFSPFDIQELHDIAHSLKYSAKPKEKYDAINRVCNRVGLVKFGAGTNRVVYRHPEFPDILFKIAADDVGLGDNPAEFRNQFLLKPFVAKCFEISPCGTVAIVERVVPITSREEFISVADDVFTLISEWLVGKYILADIGAQYYMNFGTRKSFGVVLLDYPYLYELDGDKLYCKKQDPTSKTGTCDGIIDYDDGFNKLQCTKCGAIYKAKELEKKLKDKEIIVEKEGDIKMKITVKGGKNNVYKVIDTDGVNNENFLNVKVSIPVTTNVGDKINEATPSAKKISFKDLKDYKDDDSKVIIRKVATIDNGVETAIPVEEQEIIVANRYGISKEIADAPLVSAKKEEAAIEEKPIKVNVEEKFVNGVSTSTSSTDTEDEEPFNPIVISDDIKAQAIDSSKEISPKSPVEIIDDCVNTIIESLDSIDIDIVKNDTIIRVFDALAGKLPADSNSFAKIARLASDIIENADQDNLDKIAKDDDLISIIANLYNVRMEAMDITRNGYDLDIEYNVDLVYLVDDNEESILTFDNNPVLTIENVFVESDAAEAETPSETEEIANDNIDVTYRGLKFYRSEIVNLKDLFPSQQPMDIIVMIDDDGKYLAIDGNIAGADTINDQSLHNVTTVSKKWLKDVNDMIAEDAEYDDEVVEAAPVGSLSVNSTMTNEEFLANLDSKGE